VTTSNATVRVNQANEKPAKRKARRKEKIERSRVSSKKKAKNNTTKSEKVVAKSKAAPRKRGPKRVALARLRDILGWTQANLAAHIGGSRSYVWRTENHVSTPEPGMRDSYAVGLKITVAELDLLLANKIGLDEIDKFADKVARRTVDSTGTLMLEDEQRQADKSDSDEGSVSLAKSNNHVAVVVMLCPAGGKTPSATANNDTTSIEAQPAKKRPDLRLIDCTQSSGSVADDRSTLMNNSAATTTAATVVDQPTVKTSVRPRVVKANGTRRKTKPKEKNTLEQPPLFKCLGEPDCSLTFKQAVGG